MYKKYFYRSPVFFALLLICAVMALRVSWMGKGAYAFTDETRYEASQQLVAQLLQGNVRDGFSQLLKTDARPVDCLLHAIPALIQHLMPHAEGINHPESLVWVQYFHILLFGLLAFVFYRLTVLLFPQTDYMPLFGLGIFLLIINNHVHARHILPYDTALLLLLLALGVIIHMHQTNGYVSAYAKYMAGTFAALAWLTYPGYYWLPVLMMVYLYMISSNNKRWIDGLWNIVPFLAGGLVVVLLFEAVYWYYGKSLLYSLAGLSLGINQGDYHESLQFLFSYMKESNGIAGWVLSAVFLMAGGLSLLSLLRARSKVFDPLAVLLGMAFGAWAFHTMLGEVFEFMVFYGRLIHAFVPFMIWAVLAACMRLKNARTPVLSVLVVFCVFSFYSFHQTYQKITYPREVLFKFSRAKENDTEGIKMPVIALAEDTTTSNVYCNIHSPYAYYNISSRRVDPAVFFYNTAILYPIEGQKVVPCLEKSPALLLRAPYYLCFAPYGYEGYSPAARKSLQSGLYNTQVMLKTK